MYSFPKLTFAFVVPESEEHRYNRVLNAYDGDTVAADERLRITFQSDANVEYNQWIGEYKSE